MWKKRNRIITPEDEELIRIPTIWGYVSGGILGLSGILIIFWWMGNDILFGLLFWGIFSAGIMVQIIAGVQIGKKTPAVSKKHKKMRALIRGVLVGIALGIGVSFIFLCIVIIILFSTA
jgi:Mg/Co/Ni transporter MgtE